MYSVETLNIDLKGLKEAETSLEFHLGNEYFSELDATEVFGGDVTVELQIKKTANEMFNLDFNIEGEVTVLCDRCLEEMPVEVETCDSIIAKLGDEAQDNDDDIVIVDEEEGILNIQWLIYELIALAIPIKHVHAPGKCNSAMIEKLEEHSATRSSDGEGNSDIDPRWNALKNLNIED